MIGSKCASAWRCWSAYVSGYRALVFARFAAENVEMRLFIGEDIRKGKVGSGGDRDGCCRNAAADQIRARWASDPPSSRGIDRRFREIRPDGDSPREGKLSAAVEETTTEAQRELRLSDRFTALYVATISQNKRVDLVLDGAGHCCEYCYSLVVAGEGEIRRPCAFRATCPDQLFVLQATPMALWSVRATRGCAPLRDFLSGSGTINCATSPCVSLRHRF